MTKVENGFYAQSFDAQSKFYESTENLVGSSENISSCGTSSASHASTNGYSGNVQTMNNGMWSSAAQLEGLHNATQPFSGKSLSRKTPSQHRSHQNIEKESNKRKHSLNGRQSAKRVRTLFSTYQIESLQEEYNRNRYLCRPRRQELARYLKLTERQIKIWFQNKRMKDKNNGESYSSPQLVSSSDGHHDPRTSPGTSMNCDSKYNHNCSCTDIKPFHFPNASVPAAHTNAMQIPTNSAPPNYTKQDDNLKYNVNGIKLEDDYLHFLTRQWKDYSQNFGYPPNSMSPWVFPGMFNNYVNHFDLANQAHGISPYNIPTAENPSFENIEASSLKPTLPEPQPIHYEENGPDIFNGMKSFMSM